MTIRQKTVCFSAAMYTSLMTDNTLTNLSQFSIYIPESSPTFLSVFVEIGFQDVVTATGGSIASHQCALRLGAAAYSNQTKSNAILNTGENIAGVMGPWDFTSYFTTNWSGTSMTCDIQTLFDQSTGTTLGMLNVTAMVYVTYQYDDSAATQIKTVRIPLESLAGALTTTANSNLGSNQIPQLTGAGGLLPEAGVTIRDYFFVIEGNESNNNTTTDFTISVNIDSGTATPFGTQEAGLGSDRFCRWIHKMTTPPSTTSAHNFQIWSSVANKCNHVTVTLYVTYQFTLSGTSRVLNSILLPIEIGSPAGLTGSTSASRFIRSISIQEPGTISLKQSGFRINYNTNSTVTQHNWRAGSQGYRSYTPLANTVAGMFCVQQRIDSGSAQGAGITVARGMNTFTLDGYTTNASTKMSNVSGCIILNYESDLAPEGIGAHANTVLRVLNPWTPATSDYTRISSFSFPIPEANYWLLSVGFMLNQWQSAAANAITFDTQVLSGEGKGAGWEDIYTDAYIGDAELANSHVWMRGRDVFKRFPSDADPDRLDIETARDFRTYTPAVIANGMLALITYHNRTWTVAGSISGHDPSKTTTLRLIEQSSGELRQTTTLSAGTTSFSFTVNDNTQNYCVDAYQDSTHVGRSNWGTGV